MKRSANARPVVFAGTVIGVLAIAGVVTGNGALFGAAVILLAAAVGWYLVTQLRQDSDRRKEHRRVWETGTPGHANVLAIRPTGSRLNHQPVVELELEVVIPGETPYPVTVKSIISELTIPAVQPKSQIDVKIDPLDPNLVVIDPDLTAFGYGG